MFLAGGAALAAEPEFDTNELSRFPALSPQEAQAAFVARPGFHVELAASEPNVASPVAMAFDESGALFVAEMRDYPLPEMRAKRQGTIRRLADFDGDGFYESSTVFLNGLTWPTSVTCWGGGVFVAAAPDLLFAKDHDGDGRAEEIRTCFTGFGMQNVQALVNGLTWSLDCRIHGATAGNGGHITSPGRKAEPWTIHGSDFSFDPASLDLRLESGTAQYGLSFDATGRKFVCSNSHHLQWVAWDRRYLNAWHPFPALLLDIPLDGPAAEVFRISPEEPWRVVRTRWRASGLVKGLVEGGGRSSGYFTSASGLTVYSGHAFPPEFGGNVFVGDVGSNLVHRKVLRSTPAGPVAERAADEKHREFLASKDPWFRPVACANGPDGCLYVVDMNREVIEHPESIPATIKTHLDLASGQLRGRIWRVVPDGFSRKPPPNLRNASPADLASALDSPSLRPTAQRLLMQVESASLASLVTDRTTAEGRVAALHLLARRKLLRDELLAQSLADKSPIVRRHSLILAEGCDRELPLTLTSAISRLLTDADDEVRVQLALTLGQSRHPHRAQLLAELFGASKEFPRLRQAVLVSLRDPIEILALFTVAPTEDLAGMLARTKRTDLLQTAAGRVLGMESGGGAASLNLWLALGLSKPDAQVLSLARKSPAHPASLRVLALAGAKEDWPLFARLLADAAEPMEVRAAAMQAIWRTRGAAGLLDAWKGLPAALRTSALDLCLSRPSAYSSVLESVRRGTVGPGEFSVSQTALLRTAGGLSDEVTALFWPPPPDRQSVIAQKQAALKLPGDLGKGHEIFAQRCAVCHRDGTEGAAVGPERTSFRNLGKPTLLVNLIDPSREVAPSYAAATISTEVGESLTGLIIQEDASQVRLRLPGGQESSLQRNSVRKVERLGRSLMPDGLEAGLSDQELADLLEYLVR